MSEKTVIFAFNGEPMCFGHALMNVLDMDERGFECKMVIEGTATGLTKELTDPSRMFASEYAKVKEKGLIDCVCQACSSATGSLDEVKEQGLPLCKEMRGHPSVGRYLGEGYTVLVF
ncbi:MAG: cytoplasmic protein [Methanomassiliicoccales archaeon]